MTICGISGKSSLLPDESQRMNNNFQGEGWQDVESEYRRIIFQAEGTAYAKVLREEGTWFA